MKSILRECFFLCVDWQLSLINSCIAANLMWRSQSTLFNTTYVHVLSFRVQSELLLIKPQYTPLKCLDLSSPSQIFFFFFWLCTSFYFLSIIWIYSEFFVLTHIMWLKFLEKVNLHKSSLFFCVQAQTFVLEYFWLIVVNLHKVHFLLLIKRKVC